MAARAPAPKRGRAAAGSAAAPGPRARPPRSAPATLTLDAELRLSSAGQNVLGARRVALLAEIARLGSITHAARSIGLSYKGAWDAIEQMGNLAGEPLVRRVAGGKAGGHTHLTPRGARLVRNFERIQHEHARFLERLNRRAGGLTQDYELLEAVAMKTSARNQFSGTVQSIRPGAVNDEIDLEVIGGRIIVATVTRESRTALGLEVGSQAFALIKASWIILMTETADVRLSARNQLAGTITRITPGAVNTEVVLEIAGGGSIAAIVTNESAKNLALAQGKTATALFKASSVIIGVAA